MNPVIQFSKPMIQYIILDRKINDIMFEIVLLYFFIFRKKIQSMKLNKEKLEYDLW